MPLLVVGFDRNQKTLSTFSHQPYHLECEISSRDINNISLEDIAHII